ncbi:MAG: cell wall-binding repeat-containing protein [Paenisporosarcina sp.]
MKIQKILGSIVLATTLSLVAANTTTQANDDTIRDYTRIAGESRYHTAIEVSQTGWNSATTVIIASGENFPDALAGAPLAKKLKAPILLVKKSSIDADVIAEIKRLGAKKAIILGGEGTISSTVQAKLKTVTPTIQRIEGDNRYETAENIALQVGGSTAVVVNGASFADSLAIASYAAQKGMPILLTTPSEIRFKQKYSNYIVVGGTSAIRDSVLNKLKQTSATRVSGKDRYATMKAVVDKYYPATGSVPLVASGVSYADALTGSVYAANKGVPVLLVGKDTLPAATKNVIENKKMNSLKVVGGKQAVSKYALGATKPVVTAVSNPTPVASTNDKLVAKAKQYLGTPYVFGGTTPSGFDCSGYIYYVHNAAGIKLTRTNTSGYYSMTTKVSSPQPGDLVFFSNTYKAGISHMGIYIGNGSFIHAGGDKVQINKVTDYYWKDKFTSYNRFK